ncbi:MAG: hypothetical protein ABDH28_00530 [Brevinematia bacterium]
MKIDYFTISQLKIPELYRYINQKKSLEARKDRKDLIRKVWVFISSLGFEFFLFLICFTTVGVFLSPIFSALGVAVSFLFVFLRYISFRELSKFEKLLKSFHLARVKVIKEGRTLILSEDEIEIGDIVAISKGERIPFDLRVTESNSLIVDESKVFGEERRVGKSATVLPRKDFKIYELSNVIFSNSLIVKGSGKGIVVNKPNRCYDFPDIQLQHPSFQQIILTFILSLVASLVVFYLQKDIWSTIVFFTTVFFLFSGNNINFSFAYLKYLFVKELLSQGIILQSINKISEYGEVNKAIIKLDQYSFDLYRPSYFIVSENKTYSVGDLLSLGGRIPTELTYCFVISKVVHNKIKEVSSKIFLNSIINTLSSVGLDEEVTKEVKVIDLQVSSNIHSLSTVRLKCEGEILLGVISLSAYVKQFGSIVGVDNMMEGIVILKREISATSDASLQPIVVAIFNEYQIKAKEIEDLERKVKFFFLSEMTFKELVKLFSALDINASKFSAVDTDEILDISEEQKEFFVEKFQLFFNVSQRNLSELVKLLSRNNEIALDCFAEISQSDIGIMKIPYFGTFFTRGNLVLSTTKSFLLPFLLIQKANDFEKSLQSLKFKGIMLLLTSFFITTLLYLYGFFWISLLSPIVLILIISVIPSYTNRVARELRKSRVAKGNNLRR